MLFAVPYESRKQKVVFFSYEYAAHEQTLEHTSKHTPTYIRKFFYAKHLFKSIVLKCNSCYVLETNFVLFFFLSAEYNIILLKAIPISSDQGTESLEVGVDPIILFL